MDRKPSDPPRAGKITTAESVVLVEGIYVPIRVTFEGGKPIAVDLGTRETKADSIDAAGQAVAEMRPLLRDLVLPLLRRTAEDLLRCVSFHAGPDSITSADWRDIAPDLEAIIAVERLVGRPDDEYGHVLDPVLDAATWRDHA